MKSSPPNLARRKNIRLEQYDYSSSGAYFVTICAFNRANLFGQVINDEMLLNDFGMIVEEVWKDLPKHYLNIELNEFVIMPNHFHGIIEILENHKVGEGLKPSPTKQYGLAEIVRGFKTFSAKKINLIRNTPGIKVWQRNYYERIIRSDNELKQIQEYIKQNPLNWALDKENKENQKALKEVY